MTNVPIVHKELHIATLDNQSDTYLSQIQKLYEKDIVCRSNCKFCVHPKRFEAEKVWEDTKSIKHVLRVFEAYDASLSAEEKEKNVSLSYLNARRHIYNHYEDQERAIFLKHYTDQIQNMIQSKLDYDKDLEEMYAMFALKLYQLAGDPRLDQIKVVDAMTKIQKSMTEIKQTQLQLRGDISTQDAVYSKVEEAFLFVIKRSPDETIKRRLIEAFDVFQGKVEAGGEDQNNG